MKDEQNGGKGLRETIEKGLARWKKGNNGRVRIGAFNIWERENEICEMRRYERNYKREEKFIKVKGMSAGDAKAIERFEIKK